MLQVQEHPVDRDEVNEDDQALYIDMPLMSKPLGLIVRKNQIRIRVLADNEKNDTTLRFRVYSEDAKVRDELTEEDYVGSVICPDYGDMVHVFKD